MSAFACVLSHAGTISTILWTFQAPWRESTSVGTIKMLVPTASRSWYCSGQSWQREVAGCVDLEGIPDVPTVSIM